MEESRPAKVVVGVDGSEDAQDALRWALQYASAVGGEVTAVIAWHYPPGTSAAGGIAPNTPNPEKTARRLLSEAIATADAGTPSDIEQVVIHGHPAAVLIERSREADLLVVGTRGHGGFVGMLLGSVSAHCVHHAHSPVVVVRS